MGIVAAVDRSEEATSVVSEAAALAEAFDDALHVVHVISRSEFAELGTTSLDEGGPGADLDEIRETAAEFSNKAAEDVNTPYEAVGLIGKAAEEVTKYAESQDARYVVVGGRKRSPTGKAIFGSITQDVLLNADRPVVTVLRRER